METNKTLKIGDTLTLKDVDGKKKLFEVVGVNRVTYTIVHRWPNKDPKCAFKFNRITRWLRKDSFKVTK